MMATKKRMVQLLLLLASVSVVRSGLIKGTTEKVARPEIRALSVDGLLPGTSMTALDPGTLNSSTIYRKSDYDERLGFIFGQSIVHDGDVVLKTGDTKTTVSNRLGPPDRIRDGIWTYDRAFNLAFQEECLVAVFTDRLQRSPVSGDQSPDGYGLSHTAGWFYGCIGETPTGDSTLVLSPSLTETSNQMISTSWSGARLILENGTISVGQSIESARDLLKKTEAKVQDRYSYNFNNDFVLTLGVDNGRVAELKVEPQPLYYDGPCYDGVPGLIPPSPPLLQSFTHRKLPRSARTVSSFNPGLQLKNGVSL